MNEKSMAEHYTLYLDVARQAAAAAAGILKERFEQYKDLSVSYKEGGEAVTEADTTAERCIRETIKKTLPEHDILGEEQGLHDQPSTWRWIIDPLDGTANFIKGDDNFAISIALANKKEITVAVICAPLHGVTYEAVRGQGAHKNGKPIHVNATDSLPAAKVLWCTGHIQDHTHAAKIRKKIEAAAKSCKGIGSAALECVSVAEGTHAAYASTGIKPWDVAAGSLIIEEAGGRTSLFNGKPYQLTDGEFLASNGKIHGQMVQLLADSND